MTVAFDVGPLKPLPAGVGTYVRFLARGLAEIGREDLTYVGLREDAPGLPRGVRAIRRSVRLPYPAWVELLGDRDVRRSKSGIAHFTDGLVPPLRIVPTVLTVHDLSLISEWRSHRAARYPRIPLLLAAPRLARRVITVSQATADEVMRLTGTSARKIDVIPLAARPSIDALMPGQVERAAKKYGLSAGGYLLVPATIEPRKNHIRLVRAFEQLVRSREFPSDMVLVLTGQVGWRARPILEAIDSSPNRCRITRLGYVPDDDLVALMTGAAAVVFVSVSEGFGLPVLEALAVGAPVVTSNVSSMPEVAGDAAVLVDPRDVDAIARGIVTALAADTATRARGIARARLFTWTTTAAATAAVYDAVVR